MPKTDMQNSSMKQLGVEPLRKSVIFYITTAMIVVIAIVVSITAYTQQYRHDQKELEYRSQIQRSIAHVAHNYSDEYEHDLSRIINETDLVHRVELRDREGLHEGLKQIWKALQEHEVYLEVLQIHLADGTSFLRMHHKEQYGDNISSKRAMMREIHSSHLKIKGYETGLNSNAYRIVHPIFNSDNIYIGAIELGINPNFLLSNIEHINGFTGMLFIEEKSLKLYSKPSKVSIDGYRLQSPLTPELRDIYEAIKEPDFLDNTMEICTKDRVYKTYVYQLHDFNLKVKTKIVFFQDITKINSIRSYLLVGFALAMLSVIGILKWLLYRRLHTYELNITDIYEKQIAKHKELEKALVKTKNQFEQFMENIPAKVTIKDNDNNIIYANRLTLGFLNQKSIVGKNAFDVLPYDVAQRLTGLNEEVNKRGIAESIIDMTINDELHIFRVISFIIDSDSDNKKIGTVYFDITKEMLLHEKLEKEGEKSKQLGELLEESINEIYIFSKRDYKFLYINKGARQNIGYSSDEIIKMVPPDLVPTMSIQKLQKILKPLQDELKMVFLETQHKRKDGTTYPIEVYIQSVIYNEVEAYSAVIIDISEKNKIIKELYDKEELLIAQSRHAAMGEMISMIAHQWRQPISVIAMDANNILADIELEIVEEDTLKATSQDIIKQTQELSKTIDDFRNFLQPEKTSMEVFLLSIVDDALGVMGKSLQNNQIELSLDIDKNSKIVTYPRELMQVIINIIKNAKEMLIDREIEDKHILIKSKDSEEFIIVEIYDNAGGIDEDIKDMIFDPYFTTKGEKNGTGLGLYMSRTIIQKHLNGSLHVENVDDGVCFTISIPKRKEYE